jgi:hypothetical protein
VRSSTGEHCYGYSLRLWRHNGRILGLFNHHEGFCGDPPCEVLQDVSYDGRTGHLSFAALNEKFIGTLRRDDVVGTIDPILEERVMSSTQEVLDHHLWIAETADNVHEMGTDTFVVRNGQIVVHSFAMKTSPKG